jgi:hypothetical protein
VSDVVAWLESPEGDAWSYEHMARRVGPALAEVYPEGIFSASWRDTHKGPVNPEHDPCGRPPMPP